MIYAIYTVDYLNKYSVYFSHPRSGVMWAMIDLHDYLCFYLLIIINLVLVFFFYTIITFFTFNKYSIELKRKMLKEYVVEKIYNFSHAPILEFIGTLTPGIILIFMAYPSLKLLYAIDVLLDPLITVVIYGNQGYGTYEYANFNVVTDLFFQLESTDVSKLLRKTVIENKLFSSDQHFMSDLSIAEDILLLRRNEIFFFLSQKLKTIEDFKISFDSIILTDEQLPQGYPRLLAVDQVLILPADTSVRLLVTSNDVIHSGALPSHGIKMDAIPGRINQVSFNSPFLGTSGGQCSELCGINHGFMPIEIRVLELQDFFSFIRLHIFIKQKKIAGLLVGGLEELVLGNIGYFL